MAGFMSSSSRTNGGVRAVPPMSTTGFSVAESESIAFGIKGDKELPKTASITPTPLDSGLGSPLYSVKSTNYSPNNISASDLDRDLLSRNDSCPDSSGKAPPTDDLESNSSDVRRISPPRYQMSAPPSAPKNISKLFTGTLPPFLSVKKATNPSQCQLPLENDTIYVEEDDGGRLASPSWKSIDSLSSSDLKPRSSSVASLALSHDSMQSPAFSPDKFTAPRVYVPIESRHFDVTYGYAEEGTPATPGILSSPNGIPLTAPTIRMPLLPPDIIPPPSERTPVHSPRSRPPSMKLPPSPPPPPLPPLPPSSLYPPPPTPPPPSLPPSLQSDSNV